MKKSFLRKIFTVISVFSIISQSLTPYAALLPQQAFAQEVVGQTTSTDTQTTTVDQSTTPQDSATPTPSQDQTTPTETVTPTPTEDPALVTPTPTEDPALVTPTSVDNLSPPISSVEPAPVSDPSSELQTEQTPQPVIEKECLSNEAIVDTTNDNWNIDLEKGTSETKEKVKLGVKYVFPQENKVSITFKCLPKDDNLRTSLKIQQIKVSDLQLPEGINPYGEYAYDITTGMQDGNFEYEITLPKPTNQSVEIIYMEGQNSAPTTIDNDQTSQEGDKIKANDINHFTIFVVVNPNPAGNGSTSNDTCLTSAVGGAVTCYNTLQAAIDAAINGDTININSNISVNQMVIINKDVLINGNGFTISPTFTKTDNSNNAVFGIVSSGVTIGNLTIDGTSGTNLHGINIYMVNDILLNGVSILNNDYAGVVVNGSIVTVNNVTTAGNGWGGINVDQGTGVTTEAKLIINGTSLHNEATHIWLDDTTKNVSVQDTNPHQYNFTDYGNLRVYMLKTSSTGNSSADLDQYDNDAPGIGWQNGNLNSNDAKYHEGDSVPYRFKMSDVGSGSHTITIEWDTTKSGKHALDYITTYNRTEPAADPCSGIAGCSSPSVFPIPAFPGAVNQIAGNFTLFNGTISAVSAYTVSGTDNAARITITFTSSSATPVLAVGGHIASQTDWGTGNAAGAVPGSPYHMRLIDIDGGGGNQDRSLAAGAILPTPGLTTQISSSTITIGQSVTDTATYTEVGSGPNGNGVVSGTTQFYVCGPGSVTPCTSTSTPVGGSVTNSSNTATSTIFTPQQTGTYCFAAYYTPDANAQYSPINSTVTTNECVTVSNPPTGTLIVNKVTNPANDATQFSINATGSGTITVPASRTTLATNNSESFTVTQGNYWISETVPAGWSKTGDTCQNVFVPSGQTVNCTITNTRDTGTITILKNVDNNNDGDVTDQSDVQSATDWTWDIANGEQNIATGQSRNLVTGNYTVSEDGKTDYHLVGWACTDQTSGLTNSIPVNLASNGQSITCTITNAINTGTVVVHKNVQGPNGEDVTDNSNYFEVSLDTGTGQTISDNLTVTYNNVPVGSHTITESLIDSDYTLYGISSVAGTAGNTSGLTINVTTGTNNVYVTNRQKSGTITVVKDVVNSNGGAVSDSHTFTVNLNPGDQSDSFAEGDNAVFTVNPGTYTASENDDVNYDELGCKTATGKDDIVVGSGESVTVTCTNKQNPGTISGTKFDENQNVLSGWTINLFSCTALGINCTTFLTSTVTTGSGYSFSNLVSGFYRVVEIMQAGWTNVSSLFHDFTINPGSTITQQDFVNKGALSITACKYEDSNGTLQGGTPTAVNNWTFTLGSTVQSTGVNNNCTTFTDLKPGTYTVTELPLPPGWFIADDSQGSRQVVLTNGNQNVNFFNYQKGSITVNKDVDTDGDGQVDVFGADDWAWNINGGDDDFITGTTQDNLDPNTYTISEVQKDGYHVTNLTCNDTNYGAIESQELTLNSNGSIDCTFTNTRDTGTITVDKVTNPEEDPTVFDINLTQGNITVNTSLLSDTDNPDTYQVLSGTYELSEETVPGWDLTDAICTRINEEDDVYENFDPRDEAFEVNNGDEISCTFTNTKRGKVIVTKYNDPEGEGIFNPDGQVLSGWTIRLDGLIATTSANGQVEFDDLLPGNYFLNEDLKNGWEQTNLFCDQEIINGEGFLELALVLKNVFLDPGQTVNCSILNHNLTPILTISKVNDAAGDKSPGNTVGFTITITADKEGGPADNVQVIDLLPQGFVFNSSSWKVVSSDTTRGVDGNITSLLTAPTYASPGTWSLGHMNSGETLTLYYTATIDGSQATGIYYDNAWAVGNPVDSSDKVFAKAFGDGDLDTLDPNSEFVGTQVSIVNPNQAGVDYKATSTKEVLGASTYLPATGENTLWVIIATLLMGLGFGTALIGVKLRKKHE